MTTETMTEDLKKRISTIQKLLNQAQCPGATAAEAEAFMGMRQKFIEKYNITEAMIQAEAQRQAVDQGQEATPIISKTVYERNKGKMPSWILFLANGVAFANRCSHYYSSSRYHGYIGAYGTEGNLESFKMLMPWLIGEVDRLYQEEKPSWLDRSQGRRWATSFRNGCANRIAQRLRKARREAAAEMKAEAKMTTEERYKLAMDAGDMDAIQALDRQDHSQNQFALAKVETALAKLDDDEKRTKEKFNSRKWRKGGGRNLYGTSSAGFSAGSAAGNRANISGSKGWIG